MYSKVIQLYLSDYTPLQVITRYCIQFPMLYSEPLVLIYLHL